MLTLPGSVLWLFLLVYFAFGQISDTLTLDTSDTELDEIERAVNKTSIQSNEEEKRNQTSQVETETQDEELKEPDKPPETSTIKTTRKPQESNGIDASGRDTRRRTTHRTSTSDVTKFPQMSQERRNSYLSIAERRKYYNRTRSVPKKVDLTDVELVYQETTNKLVISTTETSNEIYVKKPVITKNETNQRLVVANETQISLPKPQTRQAVIQSQYQFGQKLKKPATRTQEDEASKRKKEKSKMESTMEISTNKLNRNYPTQSTKLIKVDKNLWTTTTIPDSDVDVENLVMHPHRNGTDVRKLEEYITANNSEPVILHEAEQKKNQTVPEFTTDHHPLPLSYDNVTEADKMADKIQSVYNQEIFKLNPSSVKAVKPPNANSTDIKTTNTSNLLVTTTETVWTFVNASTPSTILQVSVNKTEIKPVTAPTTHSYSRNGKLAGFSPTSPTILKANYRTTTPMVRVIPEESVPPDVHNIKVPSEAVLVKAKPTTKPPTAGNWSSTEEYPLTIELNENNKRVLSEMFQSSTTSEPRKTDKESPTTSKPTTAETVTTTTEKTTTVSTTTTTTTTTENSQVAPPDEFPEDHKAQGTQYNTKFYIVPNRNRSEVIKVVEAEEDEENELGLASRSAGIAIYVLAAFGLVPLLLALIFGTRILVQRHQRQYECESDGKSDISTIESQTRQERKKKGSNDLKKSPSNVTTTTLVTTTRLPRVQHWENCDKQGNKNWEFPRSKLRLMTILGQGNFGQVWKAEAEDMPGHEGVTRLVAVKTVKEGATEKEHSEFIKELEIMQQIGSHPNIVTLLGCCTDQEPYYLIMEYVKYGKLLTYLREHRINENYYNFSNNSDALTSRDLTVFAYCVARGMEYLASRGIIHRDLAARNVLVDHTKLCKIADFGMSRSVRDFEDGQVYEERQHKGALPIRWMAPESLVYSVFTYKSDVWSFGIVMWEIVTLGSTPYPNMGAREVMRKVRDGYRLERPSHCKPEFYRLISHCWAHDPNKRPDFSELRHELSNLLDNPTKDGSYVDLDRFAVDNNFHISSKTNDLRMIERNEFKTLKRLGDWDNEDWPEESKRTRMKKGRNNGKGTVTLTGQGSFTVNSRILEKEFKMI